MAVRDEERGGGYSGPREQVYKTNQEIQCGLRPRAGVHQGTFATCGCSFLVPSLSPSSATAAPAAVPAVKTSTVTASQPGQGPAFTGKRLRGEPDLSVLARRPLSSPVLAGLYQLLGKGLAHTQQGCGIGRWARLRGIPSGLSKDQGVWRGSQKGSWAGARGKSLLGKPGPNHLPCK